MGGGHGRCEQRCEVFVKIKKIYIFWGVGGRVGGARMVVNVELRFL